jgi:large conductance mechanosensitive channel
MFKEFKEFALRGNVVDMAIGIAIGAAFGTIVKSLVDDVLMPPIGLALGGVDFGALFAVLKPGTVPGPYETIAQAQEVGAVTLNYGLFINSIISFLIIALALFFVVRLINRLQRQEEEAPADTRPCPFCQSDIALTATRCPYCTSQVEEAAAGMI